MIKSKCAKTISMNSSVVKEMIANMLITELNNFIVKTNIRQNFVHIIPTVLIIVNTGNIVLLPTPSRI